jgi:hypothetical protein
MKKVVLNIVTILLITLWACEQESSIEEQNVVEDVKGIDTNVAVNIKGPSGRLCSFNYVYGRKICNNPFDPEDCECISSGFGICDISMSCTPDLSNPITPPPVLWNFCKIIPCDWRYNNPWSIYYKVDPKVFGSFVDQLELVIDPVNQAMPFAMNKNILGLQFYKPNNMMYRNSEDSESEVDRFFLKEKLVLDYQFAKKMGLKGNVIKPGKYPVIFNKKNKTYNVILKVK